MKLKIKKSGFCKNEFIAPSYKAARNISALLLIIAAVAILPSAAFADLYLNSQTGNIYLNTTNTARMQISSGGNLILLGQANVSFPANLTVDSGTLFVDSAGNRVGIGTINPINALTAIGDVSAFGSLNATYINATEIRQGINQVQTINAVFNIGNYSSEYGLTGFKIANYSAEYASTGFKIANYSAEYAASGFDRENATDYIGGDNASLLRTINISKDLAKFFSNFNLGNVSNNTLVKGDNATLSLWDRGSSTTFLRNTGDKVGIGTTTPATTLDVKGKANFTGNFSVGETSNILFVDNTSGNVGIGTTGTTAHLHEISASLSPNVMFEETIAGSAAQLDLKNPTRTWRIYSDSSPDIFSIQLAEDAIDDFVITPNHKVGIGTITPDNLLTILGNEITANAILHLNASDSFNTTAINVLTLDHALKNPANSTGGIGLSILFRATDNASQLYNIGNISAVLYNSTNGSQLGAITFSTAGPDTGDGSFGHLTERMRIDGYGRVGIGTTAPNAKLTVAGGVNISEGLNVTKGDVLLATSSGNVGIGTSAPNSKLEVNGTVTFGGDLNIPSNNLNVGGGYGSGGVSLIGTGADKGSGQFAKDIMIDGAIVAVYDVEINKSFIPVKDLYSLMGNVTNRFLDLFVANIKAGNVTLNVTGNVSIGQDTLFIDNTSSKVGIGTALPAEKLVVIGNANISGTLNVSGRVSFPNLASCDSIDTNANGVLSCGTDAGGASDVRNSTSWNRTGTNVILANEGDKVGIGTTSPATTLDVKGKANFTGNFSVGETSNIFFVDNTSSRVGIGTASPGADLNLVAASGSNVVLRIDGVSTKEAGLTIKNTGTGDASISRLQIYTEGAATTSSDPIIDFLVNGGDRYVVGVDNDDSDKFGIWENSNPGTNPRLIIDTSGNVGIGKTNPNYKLDVAGTINASGLLLENGTFSIGQGGSIGIGTNSPTAALVVVGNASFNRSTGGSSVFIDTTSNSILFNGENGSVYQPVYGTDDDLVLYLPFSENAINVSNRTYDRSPYGNDGLLVNMNYGNNTGEGSENKTGWAAGKYGNAIDFDGSNDYVNVNTVTSGGLFGNAFTISAWAKLNSWGSNQEIFSTGLSPGTTGDYIAIEYAKTPNKFFARTRIDAVSSPYENSVASINNYNNDVNWHHLALVVNADGHITGFYVDGVNQGSNSTFTYDLSSMATAYVGQLPYAVPNVNTFNGSIDEVMIYKRALAPEEIRTHYLRGKGFGATGAVTADKFRVVNTSGARSLELNTTAFDVKNASGGSTLYLDKTNSMVGIGTTAPTRKLHVIGDANISGRLDVGKLNITGVSFSQGDLDAAGSLRVAGGANISGDLGVSGKIGAGTLAPITTLDVKGKANFTGNFSIMNASDTIFFVDNTSGGVGIGAVPTNRYPLEISGFNNHLYLNGAGTGSNATIFFDTVDDGGLNYNTAYITADSMSSGFGDERLVFKVIQSDGVGWDELLELNSGGSININNTGSPQLNIISGTGNNDAAIKFHHGPAQQWTIRNNGNDDKLLITNGAADNDADAAVAITQGDQFGINATNPAQTLTVQGTLNVTPAGQGSTPALFATSSGNVGIGKTNPNYKLDVAGTINASGLLLENGTFSIGQGGSIGIGTNSPNSALVVVGNASFNRSTGGSAIFFDTTSNSILFSGENGSVYQPVYGTDDDLVLYLPFSENAINVSNKTYDRSPYGNDGALRNMNAGDYIGDSNKSGWSNGKYGNAMDFDGINDYVNATNNAILDITEAITVSAWIKPTSSVSSADSAGIVGKTDSHYMLVFDARDGQRYVEFRINGGSAGELVRTSNNAIPSDAWSYVAATYDRTSLKMYLNGINVATQAQTASINSEASVPVTIGRRFDNSSSTQFFNGTIDEVMIYKRALAPEEIRTSYLRGKGFGATGSVTADKFRVVNTSGSRTLELNATSFDVKANSGSSALYVDKSNGNVGIGTAGPSYNLVVGNDLGDLTPSANSKLMVLGNTAGNTYFVQGQSASNNVQYDWIYSATPANAYAQLATYGYSNPIRIDGSTVVLQSQSNGNVGIGTTAPQNALDVVGAVTVSKGLNASNLNVTGFSITDDSLVTLADGSKKKIKDIKAGEEVLTLEESSGKLVPRKVNALLDHGVKPIYEMATEDGRAINTTAEHPYLAKLYSKEDCDKYAGNVWNKEPDEFNGEYCMRWVQAQYLKEGDEIAAPKDKYQNKFFDLRNSTNSAVVNTLINDCSLKCGSFDQIGHLPMAKDKARYSVSPGSEINELASFRNFSYLDNENGLIAPFNSANIPSNSVEESPERNLILDLCSSISLNKASGQCSLTDFEKIISFVTPLPISPVNTTVASTTNSTYLNSGCNFLSFPYIPALTSLASRIASSSVSFDFETILLNSSKSSCSISRLMASSLATSDQFIHGNLSIFAFNSPGTPNDTFAIYASPLCLLNNSNSSNSVTLFSNALLNTSGQFMSLCLSNLSLSSFGNDIVTVGILDNLLTLINSHYYVKIPEDVQIFKSFGSDANSDITFEKIASIKTLEPQHVYDLSIEGTRNFIANDIVAHNTYLATSSGNVGIGTTKPASKLEVAGSFNATNGAAGMLVTSDNNVVIHLE